MSNLEFTRSKPTEAVQTEEPLAAAQPPAVGESKIEAPPRNADQLPGAAAVQPSVKNEAPVAPKEPAGVLNIPSTSTAQASVTNEMPGGMDLDKIKWGAAFAVMIAWFLIVLFGKTLIRKG